MALAQQAYDLVDQHIARLDKDRGSILKAALAEEIRRRRRRRRVDRGARAQVLGPTIDIPWRR